MPAPDLARLRLKRREDRRLRAGHLWVFSNEVDTGVTPLTAFAPGDPVMIEAHDGRPVGTGYVNPHSLICARLVSRDPAHALDRSLVTHRLNVALSLRERLYPGPCYRLVFGEGDGLPGLVVDRYGDVLVVQMTTAGMERARDEVVAALAKVLRPAGILLRNDNPIREREGLDAYVEVAAGEVPEQLEVDTGGARFRIDPYGGQKTGWYYDQQRNRERLMQYARGARVLDAFSYVGGFGVSAAMGGAREVICVDGSEAALDAAVANARLNGVEDRITSRAGDAFDVLRELRAEGERFDVVVLDPPAFVKRKKDLKGGIEAYRRLNQAAMLLLGKDGVLLSASCSFHLERDAFLQALQGGARHVDRHLQLLDQGHQAPDHPVHPAIPETEYLKAFFLRVLME